ncbi:hypothetical protein [Adlercreutzia caecimuris]|uniref:AlgX/AlgJ SGNH hydrolase-like domain-containing protein n=1 Tax=Adlercreutzia caecimuris TaxID=671266 RepID=A0A4S4G1Z5_9ACTN|nr:hypothetical protein [Adlercreutzia caecimuris]THG36495.1 hypothetical protein E5986_09735 [Adlercreutzia caecimuris]
MKARNTVLSAIFCLFLVGPGALYMAQTYLHLDLPSNFTAEDSKYLAGGFEEVNLSKHFSLKGFSSEKFQSNLNTTVENNIPYRASVLLQNAALQRFAIATSNALFQFEAYPTFFGSEQIYLPSSDALAKMPERAREAKIASTKDFATGLATVAQANSDKQFFVVVADQSDTSLANPAAKLVSQHYTTTDSVEALAFAEKAPNVHLVSIRYDQSTDYYRHFYRSDHHWNGYGTLQAYEALMDAAGLASNRQNNIATIEFPDIRANGSYARKGLMLLNESVHEPQFDLTGIQATGKKIPPIIKPEGPTLIHNDAMGSVFDFYSNWYGSSDVTANLTVTNSEPLTDTKALIAMDSFNDSLHWLIAQNHRAIQCVLDLKNDSEGPETLQERIDGANADTIYFVGNPLAYARVTSTHPQYFELS